MCNNLSLSACYRCVPTGHSALSPPPYDFGALLTSYTQVSDSVTVGSVCKVKLTSAPILRIRGVWFLSLGVFMLLPLDGMLVHPPAYCVATILSSQSPQQVIPQHFVACAHLYTLVPEVFVLMFF